MRKSYSGKINIHIGMHKTATSTLQQLFKKAYEKNDKEFLYPMSGRMEAWPVAHHKLISDFNSCDFSSHDDLLEEIRDYTDVYDGNVVISCEDYSFTDNFGALIYLINILKDYEIEIFVAFRDYIGWFESFYLERAKRRETELGSVSFVRENFNKHKYSLIINFLKQLNVGINFFNYNSDDFVKCAFKDIVGFELSDSIKIHHWNQGYSYPMTKVLMNIYKENPELSVERTIEKAYHMEKFLGVNKKDFPVFSDEQKKQILEWLAEERALLEQLIPDMVDNIFAIKPMSAKINHIPDNEKELVHYLFSEFISRD
jgi:hypothetical protein